MESKLLPTLILLVGLGVTCVVNGCGDDDGEGTCQSACNRILNCASYAPCVGACGVDFDED